MSTDGDRSDPSQRQPSTASERDQVESLEDVPIDIDNEVASRPSLVADRNDTPLAAPASLRELFLAFNWLALQGFGGVLPVTQRELVERRRWLSREQFVEMLAVSQVLPGPNIVNLALMFGDRAFGARGAIAALAGMLLLPMAVVLSLTAVYGRFAEIPAVAGALRGMGAVAAGLVIATGLKLLVTLRRHALGLPLGLGLAGLMALGSAWLHWPLIWLLAGLGIISCAIAWHRLGGS